MSMPDDAVVRGSGPADRLVAKDHWSFAETGPPPRPEAGVRNEGEELRRRMLAEQLVRRGIRDDRVLSAMGQVPRHEFVPDAVKALAYEDRALPIGDEQTVSQPYIVGLMLEALSLGGQEKVLEVGTGSGYVTTLLSNLCSAVYTVERTPQLFAKAKTILEHFGCTNVESRMGDGSCGWPEAAPFDRIVVGAGAPEIPRPLKDQLAVGGIMVIPLGNPSSQRLVKVVHLADGDTTASLCSCVFVPLIGEHGFHSNAVKSEE